MIIERLRTFIKSQAWISFLIVFLGGFLSYALYIPWLGIYGDDWQYFYVYHLLGSGEYGHFVMADRPFSAWVYWLYTPIFGEHYLGYQLLLFVLRIAAAMAFWWVLQLIWKNKPWQITWLALLFVVYPSFKQEPLPLEYVLHFTILILFLISIGLMILSIQKRNQYWGLTSLALVLSAGMFSVEYFVGLEFIRPLIIWKMLKDRDGKTKWTDVVKHWIPYGLVLAGFYYWRIFIYSFQEYKPVLLNNLATKPGKTVIEMGWRVFQDLVTVVLKVWGQAFSTPDSFPAIFLQAGIILAGFALIFFVIRRASHKQIWNEDAGKPFWGYQAFFAGLGLMLLAGIPFWVTGIPLWLDFPWDRTSLAFMPGACLVVVGLVELLFQPKVRAVVLAGLVALSFGIHYLNSVSFINEWQEAKNLLWQLTWRAPMIKPGTILLTDKIPLNYYGDNSLSPAINWTYAPDWHQAQIPYRLFDLNIRQDMPAFANLGRNLEIDHYYRSFDFKGTTNQLLVVSLQDNACLRIYGVGDNAAPGTSDRLKDSFYLSDLKLIDPSPIKPAAPPTVTGNEAPHGWCYYFEKADLARQQGNWQQVASLGKETSDKKLEALSSSEYLVFIEGFAAMEQWDMAKQFSQKAMQDAIIQPQLCGLWQNISQSAKISENGKLFSTQLISLFKCQANAS